MFAKTTSFPLIKKLENQRLHFGRLMNLFSSVLAAKNANNQRFAATAARQSLQQHSIHPLFHNILLNGE